MASSGPAHVLITGASGGIGSALARAYAGPGVRLVLTGRDAGRLGAIAAACRDAGALVEAVSLDVTDAAAVRRCVEAAEAVAPLDLVIANAGVSSAIGPDGAAESWPVVERLFAVNLMGVLHTLTPAIERMRPRRRGHLAIIGSLAAWYGLPSCPAYSASKAAVETYGQALGGWLAADGIGVTVVSPGYVESAMSARVVGPKPFLISADDAAARIRRAIAGNRARVSFPFPLNLGTWLLARLPTPVARRIEPFFHFTVRPEG
jgi:short-subunit dehydrogenase